MYVRYLLPQDAPDVRYRSGFKAILCHGDDGYFRATRQLSRCDLRRPIFGSTREENALGNPSQQHRGGYGQMWQIIGTIHHGRMAKIPSHFGLLVQIGVTATTQVLNDRSFSE
jgi:hypothetical protein